MNTVAMGLPPPVRCVGVGVNSSLQCYEYSSYGLTSSAVKAGHLYHLYLTVGVGVNSTLHLFELGAVGVGVNSALQCGWGWG
jgi:hypothetical protein